MQSESFSTTSQKILIATADTEWALDARATLSSSGYQCQHVREGKECQLALYREKYSTVVLDPDIKNHSGIEVLKFLKINHPSTRVVLLFHDKKRSDEYQELRANLTKIGVTKAFTRPFHLKLMIEYLNEMSPARSWKHLAGPFPAPDDHDVRIQDKDCTRVEIETFLSGNVAVFDYFIRLKENHFVKIFRRGETFDPVRVQKYSQDGVKYLYFLTRDRRNYINYMNELVKSTLSSQQPDQKKAFVQLRNVSEKFMEEIHTRGLRPDLIEESRAISENMYQFIRKSETLKGIMDEFEEFYPEKFSHSFLVSFFSTVICKGLSWAGPRTLEAVSLGACLHDIGLVRLPASIRDRDPSTLSAADFAKYCEHPRIGADILGAIPDMNPQVIQIVYQHHERTNGSGYPNGLTGVKIYPLAKIVALADEFAHLLVEKRVSPLDGIRIFLQDREQLLRFDPAVIRALVSGFIREDKE